MTPAEIKEILDQHKIWSEDPSEGKCIDLRGANLQGIDFREANLNSADLQGANLKGAHLSSTNLKGVGLRGADLRGADLSYANISYANLKDARLYRSVFSGTIFSGVDLTKIKDYETTKVWRFTRHLLKLIPIKELVIWQKMIADKDKNLAILYKNTWMADDCKKILRNYYK